MAFRDAKHGAVVGGDYQKENDAGDNLAVTSDGGVTWTLVKGLSGFRSVIAFLPETRKGTPAGMLVALARLARTIRRTMAAPGPRSLVRASTR